MQIYLRYGNYKKFNFLYEITRVQIYTLKTLHIFYLYSLKNYVKICKFIKVFFLQYSVNNIT